MGSMGGRSMDMLIFLLISLIYYSYREVFTPEML
jgi:hypothetical protein